MKHNRLILIGMGATVGLMGATNFVFATDYIITAPYSLQANPNRTEATILKSVDKARADFYGTQAKKLDPNASNQLYKVSEHGYTYWSPVRAKTKSSGGVNTGEYIYENFYTPQKYGIGDEKTNPSYLGTLWMPKPEITRNFKSVQMIRGADIMGTTKESMKTIGQSVEHSPMYTYAGTFKGYTGRWRFSGYSNDGSSLMEGRFPGDFTSRSILDITWDNYVDGGTTLFTPTDYDSKENEQVKKNLIQRLLNQYPIMKQKHDVDTWMKILSLQTEPEKNPYTGVADGLYGGAQFAAYHTGATRYRVFILYQDETTYGSNNLYMKAMRLKDSGSTLKTATRPTDEKHDYSVSSGNAYVVPGMTYTVEVDVKNMNKKESTKYTPATVDLGIDKVFSKSDESDGWYKPENDDVKSKATKTGSIAANSTATLTGTITIPSDAKPGATIRLGGIINDNHRVKGDNLNYNDDDLTMPLTVQTGNLSVSKVVLYDTELKKEVSEPVPGHQYKLRYYFTYSGPNISQKTKITVNYTIQRKLPGEQTETFNKETVSLETTLSNGKSYYVESKTAQWYEIPWVSTNATLSSSVAGLNNTTNDDKWSKTWAPEYDYSIKDLQVLPRTVQSDTKAVDGKQHYAVSFTVVSTMPQAAKNDNYAKDVNIQVSFGGVTKMITEHIKAGDNKNIVVDFDLDKKLASGSILNATVKVNPDKLAYENGKGAANNTAYTTVTQSNIVNDSKGYLVNSNTNTGAYVTTPADPAKMANLPKNNNRTENRWTQTYQIDTWTGRKITYTAFNGKKTYSFYRYTPTSSYTQSVQQTETFKIKDILMKSKVTTDNQWGANKDGWVSMINDPGHAQVKAGNGYQLKIITEYSTNALSTQPTGSISGGSGKSVRPQNILPNLSTDIFFQTSDGKILSASGYKGTHKVFTAKVVEQSANKVVVEYTLNDTYTMGIKTPGRIYISEDTPNGMYSVRAWTPVIPGVAANNKTMNPLWDIVGDVVSSKPKSIPTSGTDSDGNPVLNLKNIPQMHILVVGSNKDDLINSIVQ